MSLDNGARSEPYGPDRPHIPSVLGCRRRPDPGARAGLRGLSSAGRATESHSVGHRFDPDRLHHLASLRWRSLSFFGLRAFGATGSTTSASLGWRSLSFFGLRAFGATGSTSAFCGEAAKAPTEDGALAQLGERVLCKHEVTGSIPVGSTRLAAGPSRHSGLGR